MDNWTAEVRAQADNFKVDIPSMAKLKVSPNVVVKASPKTLRFKRKRGYSMGKNLLLKAYQTMQNR